MHEPTVESPAQERASAVVARLRAEYPDAHCSLNFRTPLELLVATVLSAQCTDERVNQVTARLFEKYRSAADYAEAVPGELEEDIKQTGFYRNKAKHLREAGVQLVGRFGGEVPRTMDELTRLPGVARKTANVVLGNAYGIVEGVVVDTHVARLSQRLALSASEDPAKIEQDLMALLPRADWLDFSHLLIYHGRAVCQARKPLCGQCRIADLCPTGQANLATAASTAAQASVPAPVAASKRTTKPTTRTRR
jgi:endonuclease-3